MRRHLLNILILLLFCCCGRSFTAEDATVPQAADLFKFEQEARKNTGKNYEAILLAYQNLPRIPANAGKVKTCLQIERDTKKMLSDLDSTAIRQSSLNVLIDQLKGKSNLLPQDTSFLNHFQQKLIDMGKEQITMRKVLQSKYKDLLLILRTIPPPQQFITRCGLEMTLLGKNRPACYVSRRPINITTYQEINEFGKSGQRPGEMLPEAPLQGDVNLAQAEEFCRHLSHYEAFTFRLPKRSELAQMERQQLLPEIAVWSMSEWSRGWEQQEISKRFGCKLFGVWDPARVLRLEQNAGFVGELPQAFYPQLGFMVVTDVATGNQLRLQRIRDELLQETAEQ